MEYTRKQNIKRDEVIVVADIYSNGGDYAVEVLALKDSEDDVVKVEAYDAYTTYAQWMEPGEGYLDDETEGYWEIDGGSFGD